MNRGVLVFLRDSEADRERCKDKRWKITPIAYIKACCSFDTERQSDISKICSLSNKAMLYLKKGGERNI